MRASLPSRRARPGRGGFTLLEVAVTIVIVGIALTLVLQVLNSAQVSALQTRNEKLARELGLLTLGRIAAGLYREELRERFYGSYADELQPDFNFEVALGDETFREQVSNRPGSTPYYDAWNDEERLREKREKDEEEGKTEQPYERVKIKVSFPKVEDYVDHLILERWIPWKQVYGESEEDQRKSPAGSQVGP